MIFLNKVNTINKNQLLRTMQIEEKKRDSYKISKFPENLRFKSGFSISYIPLPFIF